MKIHRRSPGDRIPGRPQTRLAFDRLEDRLTPTSLLTTTTPNSILQSAAILNYSTTELIAETRSTQPLQDLSNVVKSLGLSGAISTNQSSVAFSTGGLSILKVALQPTAAVPDLVTRLTATGLYTSVSPNYIYSSTTALPNIRELVPNDPSFPSQFYQSIISAPQAWDKTVGSASVITAILDDGVDITHPDLKNSIWVNPAGNVGGDLNGFDFLHDNGNVMPDDPTLDQHGTEIAGVIAAEINNATGIAGVASASKIMPLKVVGNGATSSLTLARAVDYAVKHGARIINSSLNIDPFVSDPTFQAAVAFAYSSGVLWVNSAGNQNVQNPPRQQFNEMLIVGATDANDVKTAYSNYGTGLDLMAPGGDSSAGILTTVPGGLYAPAVGTSMSAALVSGAAALVWSAFPNYTRDQVYSTLLTNAADISAKNPGFDNLLGAGRLNVGAAVNGPGTTVFGDLTGLPAEGTTVADPMPNFDLRLKAPLDPSTVNTTHFLLQSAGTDGLFGTSDDKAIPLTLNDAQPYKMGTNNLAFTITTTLENGLYRFISRNVTDPFGQQVADVSRTFKIGQQLTGQVFEDVSGSGVVTAYDPPLANQIIYADTNGNGSLDQVNFVGQTDQAPIPDGSAVGNITVIPVTGVSQNVGLITLNVLINHQRPSDLVFTLTSPSGTSITLLRNAAVTTDPLQPMYLFNFSDAANNSVVSDPTLTAFQLTPEQPLATFAGENANGNWVLKVQDLTSGYTGIVQSVILTVSNEPTAVTNSQGYYSLANLPIGNTLINVAPPSWMVSSNLTGPVSVAIVDGTTAKANFALVRQNSIYGRVLADNGNGAFSPTDTGVSGVKVYIDLNNNGIFNSSDPTAVTDANGVYRFSSLAYGSYTVGVVSPDGMIPVANTPATRTADISSTKTANFGNDFLFQVDPAPVRLSVTPVSPAMRNSPVESVSLTLSQTLPNFTTSNVTLTRDGVAVPLTNVSLFGPPSEIMLTGLSGLTSISGNYQLIVAPPAPAGQPTRQPAPVTISWTVDTMPLSGTLSPNQSSSISPIDSINILFNKPVTGLTLANILLSRDGAAVNLLGAGLITISPSEYQITGLANITNTNGLYTAQVMQGSVQDAAGNTLSMVPSVTVRVGPKPESLAGRFILVGAGAGGPPVVTMIDPLTNQQVRTISAFESTFTGGVRVATGDINGDGVDDVIVVAGPGGGPRLRVFDGQSGVLLLDQLVFEPSFRGGLYVAAGNFLNNGRDQIVVSADVGGGPRVIVLNADGTTLADFFGIDDPNFRGGARVAVGDINGDSVSDLIVSAGVGGGPRVAIYDGRSMGTNTPTHLIGDFFAFEDTLRNGVYVAAGDLNGDGVADLVLGAGPGGGPRVLVLNGADLRNGTQTVIGNFFAGDPSSRAGVRVASKDTTGTGQASVLAADASGNAGTVRVYLPKDVLGSGSPQPSQFLTPFDSFGDGVFVG